MHGAIHAVVLKNTLKSFTNVSLHVPFKMFADVNLVLLDTPVSIYGFYGRNPDQI